MRKDEWAGKVMAVLRAGNPDAAMAQVKVAPTVKDLRALQAALAQPGTAGRWPLVEVAIRDAIDLLSAPRLHRAP